MRRPADDADEDMPPRDDMPQTDDALRAEQFDALVQELLPMVRQLWPELDPVAALRATAELAEARMKEGGAHVGAAEVVGRSCHQPLGPHPTWKRNRCAD